MGPEAAAGAREARGRVCPCPDPGPRRPSPPRGPERSTPWRPWTRTPQDAQRTRTGSQCEPADQRPSRPKGAFGFQHPVRLYLPISKRQEYLQRSGEKVLASFPVQATIHFYNDASESEDDEQDEETQAPGLQNLTAADGRDPLDTRGTREGGGGRCHREASAPAQRFSSE